MGWFPVFANFMDGKEFKGLTPTEKLYFWHLVSEFNRRGEFYQSDLEIAKTLATSEKTIRRGRAKLTEMGLIKAKPGTRTKRNQLLATRYLWVKFATMKPKEDRFFAQMPRHTFNTMLNRMRESRLQAGDVVVYVSLYYWFWRNRGKYEERDRFFITKKRLQSLTNLNDASIRISRGYEAIVFSGGKHLFEYQEEHHRVIFRDWSWCADPDKNEHNRRNAEKYISEIKESVAREKHDRQLKVQQKISKTSLPPFEFFRESYKKKYGRFPDYNSSIREEFHEVEKAHGYGAIYQAINWYFTADIVPNGTGAKTRTIKSFIIYIDDILDLSENSSFD
jgi:hypothetical protein